jgi:hypothetical protein
MNPDHRISLWLMLTLAAASLHATAEKSYSPTVGQSFPTNVYWGDTHVHTSFSWDAWSSWGRLSPEQAYRLAKGETVTGASGHQLRLRRPLDFLLVADHASNIGYVARIAAGDQELLSTEAGQRTAEVLKRNSSPVAKVLNGDSDAMFKALFNPKYAMLSRKADTLKPPDKPASDIMKPGAGDGKALGVKKKAAGKKKPGPTQSAAKKKKVAAKGKLPGDPVAALARYGAQLAAAQGREKGTSGNKVFRQSVWEEVGANAERHNEPGKFTAFVGYEWTFNAPGAPSLHRNILFRDGTDLTNQVLPFRGSDSTNVKNLWKYLAGYEEQTGGQVLAIPHNGNLSNGAMFRLTDLNGHALTSEYAASRSRWEPIYEVTQIKGDGEAHPVLSPTDEFADFETWNGFDMGAWQQRLQTEYARSALKLGLEQQAKLGENPFKFGMIGSTDAHTSLATADEDNFWGKAPLSEPSRHRVLNAWFLTASGYAAVWARENTRASLFDALNRREVYASTGPRMTLRFFGGWDYAPEEAADPELASIGYAKGVPMGGDLTAAPGNKTPNFLIRAVRDPEGANLDRIQVIKGWRDSSGELHERIHNVALSDDRKVSRRGKVRPVGNTVNVQAASYTNTIGDPELAVVWSDPDFDKEELAFYYVRVLEIPTPRWTAYDARFYGLTDLPEEIPMVTQERAYSSPIWYTP